MDQNYKYQRIQINKTIYEEITDLNSSVTINDNKSGVKFYLQIKRNLIQMVLQEILSNIFKEPIILILVQTLLEGRLRGNIHQLIL